MPHLYGEATEQKLRDSGRDRLPATDQLLAGRRNRLAKNHVYLATERFWRTLKSQSSRSAMAGSTGRGAADAIRSRARKGINAVWRRFAQKTAPGRIGWELRLVVQGGLRILWSASNLVDYERFPSALN